MSHKRQFWFSAILISIFVHVIFCLQAASVADQGGLINSSKPLFPIFFFPHTVLVYFLPPCDPFPYHGGVLEVDRWCFAGKLAAAYPASLLYGVVLAASVSFIRKRKMV